MTPITLTLAGFIGIRDGMGRDSLTLDLAAETAGAQLVALVGGNGRGKTTILDNLHPYPVMPSRAGADGLGAFSYYDEVYLPESIKDLEWRMDERRYRSQIVIRLGARRRTEAYLHVHNGRDWRPASLADGTVSDGKMDTYWRCVEDIAGPASTFFTTSFSAQNRRQLSAYRNGEIKTLLADLLNQERVRVTGAQAMDVVRLVKSGLAGVRQQRATLRQDADSIDQTLAGLEQEARRAVVLEDEKTATRLRLDTARATLASLSAQRDFAATHEHRRAQLAEERRGAVENCRIVLEQLDRQTERERQRLKHVQTQILERRASRARELDALSGQRTALRGLLHEGRHVERAARRLPLLRTVDGRRSDAAQACAQRVAERDRLVGQMRLTEERIAGLERDAGQALFRVRELESRHGLSGKVPCAGTELQGRCALLDDARSAHALLPSADATVERLNEQRKVLLAELEAMTARLASLDTAMTELQRAQSRLRRTQARLAREASLAARRDDIARAAASLAELDNRVAMIEAQPVAETDIEARERRNSESRLDELVVERARQVQRHQGVLERIDRLTAALPAPFDVTELARAQSAVAQATRTLEQQEQDYMAAVRARHRAEELRRRGQEISGRVGTLEADIARIESAIASWSLFTRCMGNDGVISLAIDDAGPELATLTNDLLLACYGPRFAVSIRTQVETGKGELKEGFEIVVYDAHTGASKNVTKMSGGERIWINECLTRAMALYLADTSGRRSATLFSDEADGAFDPQHKRQFLAMKREVLRIGRYGQEFFISHSPELAGMADTVLDLDRWSAQSACFKN